MPTVVIVSEVTDGTEIGGEKVGQKREGNEGALFEIASRFDATGIYSQHVVSLSLFSLLLQPTKKTFPFLAAPSHVHPSCLNYVLIAPCLCSENAFNVTIVLSVAETSQIIN